jgi:uncharacterized membrane protein YhhN
VESSPLPGTLAISLAAAVSGTLAVWGHYKPDGRTLVFVFKPLTTVLILALAVTSLCHAGSPYSSAIVAGLVCSLSGDVFLMLPSDRFRSGLVSFLLAHVCYLIAFTSDAPFASPPYPFIVWAVAGAGIARVLWPGIQPSLRWPVLFYIGFLLAMAAQAASRAISLGSAPALAACLGATLFVVSDSLLALDRFRFPFRSARALVYATYFTSQWLISVSTRMQLH